MPTRSHPVLSLNGYNAPCNDPVLSETRTVVSRSLAVLICNDYGGLREWYGGVRVLPVLTQNGYDAPQEWHAALRVLPARTCNGYGALPRMARGDRSSFIELTQSIEQTREKSLTWELELLTPGLPIPLMPSHGSAFKVTGEEEFVIRC